LEPLDLAEWELVSVAIERQNGRPAEGTAVDDDWLDKDALECSQRIADPSILLADVREALSGIQGDLSDAVSQQRETISVRSVVQH
jgi:hypothetical protein